MFYFSPVAAFILIPSFLMFEFEPLMHFHDYRSSHSNSNNDNQTTQIINDRIPQTDFLANNEIILTTVGLLLVSALLAFGLNISELMTIQHTSALTLCVIASFKFLLVLAITTVIFDHPFTETNFIGCLLSVIGIASYNYIKYKEIQALNNSNYNNGDNDGSDRKLMNNDENNGNNNEKQSLTSSMSSMTLNLDMEDSLNENSVDNSQYDFNNDSDDDNSENENGEEFNVRMIEMIHYKNSHSDNEKNNNHKKITNNSNNNNNNDSSKSSLAIKHSPSQSARAPD